MSGGSRMCVSAEMMSYFLAMRGPSFGGDKPRPPSFRPGLALCSRLVPWDELAVLHAPAGLVLGLTEVHHLRVSFLLLPRLHVRAGVPFADDEVTAVDHRTTVVRPDVAGLLLRELVR